MGTLSSEVGLNSPGGFSKCRKNDIRCEHDRYLIYSLRKRIELLFTLKCLISIISFMIKYGPRPSTVQPLWLHQSHLDSHCYRFSNYSNAPVTWNRGSERMPLGKSENPFNISIWTNVQVSSNPSNHIKYTAQGPWAMFHIKGPTCCRRGVMPSLYLMNSANFPLWALVLCVLSLLWNQFKVHCFFQCTKSMTHLFCMHSLANFSLQSFRKRTKSRRESRWRDHPSMLG